jgi:hypothetical protein
MEARKPLTHVVAGLLIAAIVIVFHGYDDVFEKCRKPRQRLVYLPDHHRRPCFFINLYGKAHNNRLGFGNLFSYGFKATAVYTLVFIGFLIFSACFFPDFKNNAIEAARTGNGKQQAYNRRTSRERD